jgi:hypothetical protein
MIGLLVIVAAVVVLALVALLLGHGRYGESQAAHPTWRPTDEQFIDPTTRRRMRVWLDEHGDRHYVPEPS